jgi:hypothetical protein
MAESLTPGLERSASLDRLEERFDADGASAWPARIERI